MDEHESRARLTWLLSLLHVEKKQERLQRCLERLACPIITLLHTKRQGPRTRWLERVRKPVDGSAEMLI